MLHLLDLTTGTDHAVASALDESAFEGGTTAWASDGRSLFATSGGRLLVVDAATGTTRELAAPLPPVSQPALRVTTQ